MGPWAFGLTAHLLVRRAAYDSVGGFVEGIRSTGDAEFCWRLRGAGWSLEYNDRAVVSHHHRETLRGLMRQVARYTAGSAWIRRRHGEPEYMRDVDARAVARGVRNAGRALRALDADAVIFRLIDGLLLPVRRIGARLPNRAVEPEPRPAAVVVCAGRFPADPEQLAAARRAAAAGGLRVEAQGRPLARVPSAELRGLEVAFAEDDADVRRWRAGVEVLARHPVRAARWVVRRRGRRLLAVAPAVRRVERTGASRLAALDPHGERLAADIGSLSGLAR
jgi:Glycosyl transferase family group 2